MTQIVIDIIAKAIKDATDEFSNPVDLYIKGEARHRWEKAHPEYWEPGSAEPPDEVDDDLEDYRIIARAVVAALGR